MDVSMNSEVPDESIVQSQKVVCGDPGQLRKTCDVVVEEMKNFPQKSMPSEIAERVTNRFKEIFRKTIQDNIEVKGVPVEMCFDESLNTIKEQEKVMMINETYLPEMGNLLVKVSDQRKSNPPNITRIIKKQLKQESQLLRDFKPTVDDMQLQSCSDENSNEEDQWTLALERFKNFSKELNYSNKNLQTEIDKMKKANTDIQFAEEIFNRETKRCFSVYNEL